MLQKTGSTKYEYLGNEKYMINNTKLGATNLHIVCVVLELAPGADVTTLQVPPLTQRA